MTEVTELKVEADFQAFLPEAKATKPMTTQKTQPHYSVVVPVYNSRASLHTLVSRLEAVFKDQLHATYEVILVDDASPNPDTWPALEALWEAFDSVHVIRLTRNFGQQAATLCGIREARGTFVLTMDDDLQHRPEDIPNLVSESAHDIVIAQFPQKQHSWWKRATSWLKGWFDVIIIGKPRHIQLSSFRLFHRFVARGIQQIQTPYPLLAAMMFYVSRDVVGVEVHHDPRREGQSNYTLIRMFKLFSNLIISNSSLLLRGVGYIGILSAVGSAGTALYYIARKLLYNTAVSGWTSLIVTNLLIGGLVLLALGIIGEYLIRIVSGTENKPMYYVRQCKACRRGSGTTDDHM